MIDQTIISEIATQLKALYGVAANDVVPIILHTISSYNMIKLGGGVAIILSAIFLFKMYGHIRNNILTFIDARFPNADPQSKISHASFNALVLSIFGALITLFTLIKMVPLLAYTLYPESYIILPLIDKMVK